MLYEQTMAFEVDHFFIMTSPGAPEAESLVQLGFSEGTPNRHEGQGTANRRFFFRNVMLELVWVCDEREARSPGVSRLRLWERWQNRRASASPFGVCLRPLAGETGKPFGGWHYRPSCVPEHRWIHVSESSERIDEPLLFYIPWVGRPDRQVRAAGERLAHPPGVQDVTRITLTLTGVAERSTAMQSVVRAGIVTARSGPEALMELEFDEAKWGKHEDFRPMIPLAIGW